MNTTSIIVAALIVIVAIIILMALASRRRRSEALKERFGPEYDQAVQAHGDRHQAEEDLAARQKRVAALNILPLTAGERDHYAQQWKQVQAEFVDAPDQAIADADRLVQQVMQQRGYPLGDFEQRAADISVDHPEVVTHYRVAHEIALKQDTNSATTEDLRQAMVHYRALFNDLLQSDGAGTADQESAAVRTSNTGGQSR